MCAGCGLDRVMCVTGLLCQSKVAIIGKVVRGKVIKWRSQVAWSKAIKQPRYIYLCEGGYLLFIRD